MDVTNCSVTCTRPSRSALRACITVAPAIMALALAACSDAPAPGEDPRTDTRNTAVVKRGAVVYARDCAACHGANLQGQPDWRMRTATGRLPAPPHDVTGHTWHHPDQVLFGIVKHGLVPPYAPQNYESDMPAFGGKLADADIWAVLVYIKSQWPADVLPVRAEMLRNAATR